jgi:Cytochrome c554 and c-prime
VLRFVSFLLIATCANAFAKEPTQTPESDAKFVGAIGCKSSSCHGGAGEKRSQYITWSQKDYHTRAYTILLDARSSRIAEAVGIHEAQSSSRCTVCHSPFQSVSQSRLEPAAHPDEGVSCESCHGAAEPWLRGHTRTDWTYATRVSAGMHDLRNLYVRANACVACHQNVETDILKAGHPPLVFELDSQSINEPKHWRDDEPQTGVRSWLIGQAVALREMSWALAKFPPAERSQVFVQWSALVWLLDKTEFGGNLSSFNSFAGVELRADEIAKRAATWNPTNDALMSMLQTLASDDSELASKEGSVEFRFFRAQRLTLALERLSVALGMIDKIDKELNALRQDVQRHYDFDAAAFAQHLRAFREKL